MLSLPLFPHFLLLFTVNQLKRHLCGKSFWLFSNLYSTWKQKKSNLIKNGWLWRSQCWQFALLKPASGYSPVYQPTGYTQADSQYNAGEPEGQISYHASDWAGWAEARWTVIPRLPCLPATQIHTPGLCQTHTHTHIHKLLSIHDWLSHAYKDEEQRMITCSATTKTHPYRRCALRFTSDSLISMTKWMKCFSRNSSYARKSEPS